MYEMYETLAQSATEISVLTSCGKIAHHSSMKQTRSPAASALKVMRNNADLTVREFADLLDIPHSSYAYYEDGYKKPYMPFDLVEKIVPILVPRGIDESEIWALAGVQKGVGSHIGSSPEHLPAYSGTLEPSVLPVGGVDYMAVGRYDARLSAGPGSIIENEEPDGYVLFEAQWLRSITRAAPAYLAVLRVDGDSMEHTLSDRDFVLVDRSQSRFGREGIYALRVGDSCWVKRLSLNLREQLIKIISDNPRYPDQEMPEDEIELIGRVVSIVGRRL